MGSVRFGIPEKLVLWARDTFDVRTFVETGTNRAGTALWAADHFDHVVTIEGRQELFESNAREHGHRKNLQFVQGDSRDLLAPTLEEVNGPAIIWLDAHWCGEETYGASAECPVLEELSAVNGSHPEHVLLIDDARFFTAPAPRPHNAADWPGLIEVCSALASGPVARYAVIHEDIIVAIPRSRRELLDEYIRVVTETQACSVSRPLWKRAIGRVARMCS